MLSNKVAKKILLIFVFAIMSISHVLEIDAAAKKKSSEKKLY